MSKKLAIVTSLLAFAAVPAMAQQAAAPADPCVTMTKAWEGKILGAYTKLKPDAFDAAQAGLEKFKEACPKADANGMAMGTAQLEWALSGKATYGWDADAKKRRMTADEKKGETKKN